MASNRKVMVLPGDGIGVEVMAANMTVMEWLAKLIAKHGDSYHMKRVAGQKLEQVSRVRIH